MAVSVAWGEEGEVFVQRLVSLSQARKAVQRVQAGGFQRAGEAASEVEAEAAGAQAEEAEREGQVGRSECKPAEQGTAEAA